MEKDKEKHSFSFNSIIAFGLVCMLIIGGVRYFNTQKTDRLFSEHYQVAGISYANLRGGGDNLDDNLSLALSFYKDRNFTAAAPFFSKYISKVPADFEAVYLAGISYLEINQFEKAIEAFKKVRINSEKHYEKATWYLALSYLREQQPDQAKTILKELIASASPYKIEEAKKILSKIS